MSQEPFIEPASLDLRTRCQNVVDEWDRVNGGCLRETLVVTLARLWLSSEKIRCEINRGIITESEARRLLS